MRQFANKYDEALTALKDGMLDTSDMEMYMDVIAEALKLQIPKKPRRLESELLLKAGWRWQCPNCKCACGNNEYFTTDDNYCGQCGQLLDWS